MQADTSLADFRARCAAHESARVRLRGHQLDFLPAGPILVVTFEPAAVDKTEPNPHRPVWAQAFVQRRGHSLLGVKRDRTDWYRSDRLHQLFRALQAQGFFSRFQQVVFYGSSMGGFAALSFAAVAPGCTVLAMNPQSSLAPDRIWFDQRFAGARASAWDGDFVDGADGAAQAAQVYVCYDPYQLRDRLHVDRLAQHNLVRLRLPFVGHATAQALNTLGLLAAVFDQAVAGTLTSAGFRAWARARVRLPDYHARLADRGVWRPRRLRCVDKALQIEPLHSQALQRRELLVPPDKIVAPAVPDATAPLPKRWPAGLVTVPRTPLIYLNLPKSASTTIQNLLLFIANGQAAERPQDIHRHEALRRSREDSDLAHALFDRQIREGALAFTFVRDPGRRAYACFNEKIMQRGPHSFGAIRQALERDWGLRTSPQTQALSLQDTRENFVAFLHFVEANLAGKTTIRRDAHWSPQQPMVVRFRQHLEIDFVGRVETFEADMAFLLHRASVRRVPDLRVRPWRHAPAAFSFDDVVTPEAQSLLDRIYLPDYTHFGYRATPP